MNYMILQIRSFEELQKFLISIKILMISKIDIEYQKN